jgi:hypothetical protein
MCRKGVHSAKNNSLNLKSKASKGHEQRSEVKRARQTNRSFEAYFAKANYYFKNLY